MIVSELRIGNYIRYRDEYDCVVCSLGHYFGTDKRHLDDSKQGSLTGSDDLVEYEPVRITEEWLVKFGINKSVKKLDRNGGEDWFDITPVMVNDDVDNPEWGYLFTMNGESLTVVKHVHQLQNLFFAITGEELSIKEA